ncbi:unnamed protein product [Moneuplotes crassus]|uniref:acylaminoacyl-peptidase n=1 Tax=Euplotes crassus TaxID=5936 RepID=A0AAD1Y761_EUPCR|nr:unnamed protein product [Moneuplotes crassus]
MEAEPVPQEEIKQSRKISEKFEHAINLFEVLATQYPNTTGVEVIGSTYEGEKLISMVVKVCFSKTDLSKFEPRIHSNLYNVNITTGEVTKLNDIPTAEPKDKQVVAKTKRNSEMILIKTEPKNDKALYLEHWTSGGYQISLKLVDCGAIYNHPVFGGISWSKNNDKITFIAEKKPNEAFTPYWDNESKKPMTDEEAKKDAKVPHNYRKWLYNDRKGTQINNFGETLTDKKHPVMVVYDLELRKITIIDIQEFRQNGNIDTGEFDDVYPAHPIFDQSGEGIVFHGYNLPIDKLGLNFCLNKPTKLYHLKAYSQPEKAKKENGTSEEPQEDSEPFKYDIETLTEEFYFAGFPKFSDDYKYLSYFGSKEEFITHGTCLELNVIKNFGKDNQENYNVIKRDLEIDNEFSGLFGFHDNYDEAKFIKGTSKLLFNTCNKGKEILVLIDVEEKTYKVLTNPDMNTNDFIILKKIQEDYAFVASSSFNEPASLYLLSGFTDDIPKWTKICQISGKNDFFDSIMSNVKVDTLTTEEGAEGYFIRVVDEEKKIFDQQKRPTILIVHGGPHGSFPFNAFLKEKLLWMALGYNLFSVNYRGSLGYGLKFAESLSGKVFTMDVDDSLNLFQQCIDTFASEIDQTRLGIYGGSHGGFLTCSIISHPDWVDRFSAACIWNPVTAMHATVTFSDIPDWHYSVACNKPNTWILSREDVLEMYDKSPISRVENVKTPSLFIIGGDDRRCPDKQGLHFYKGLKQIGVETDLHYYPNDGHAIPSLEQNIDAMMNMIRWWVDHL